MYLMYFEQNRKRKVRNSVLTTCIMILIIIAEMILGLRRKRKRRL